MKELQLQILLDRFKGGLQEIYRDRLRGVYLFGSYARGNGEAESDVDIAIVLDDFENDWAEIRRTSLLVSTLALEYEVSLVPVMIREWDWQHDDFPFYRNLRRDGIAL